MDNNQSNNPPALIEARQEVFLEWQNLMLPPM
jgi:hypothetical protein